MTDRVKGFYVALECDIRTDDVEPLLNAIRQLRGVAAVHANIADADDWMNRMQIRASIRMQLLNAIGMVFDGTEKNE